MTGRTGSDASGGSAGAGTGAGAAAGRRVTYRGTIYPWQCDHMGHMNVQHYVGLFDQATWALMSELGATPRRLRENRSGMAAVEQRIWYLRELHAGDVVAVTSGVLEVGDKTIRFFHEMTNEETGEIAARTELTGIHMDLETRRASALPQDFRERARARIEPGPQAPGGRRP